MAFDALLIAQRSMIASQSGLLVTGQNIANASSPGYTRQEIVLAPTPGPPALNLPRGVVTDASDTVMVRGVRRFRDAFLDDAYRMQSHTLAASDERQGLLDRAAMTLEESDTTGLSVGLTNFLQQVQRASISPEDVGLRQVVLSSADTIAADFRNRSQGLALLGDEAQNKAETTVTEVNALLKRLAAANQWSPTNTVAGNEGLDERDRLVDELSQKLDVTAVTQRDGTLAIYHHGVSLLYGRTSRTLQMSEDGTGQLHLATDTGRALTPGGGTLGGYFQVHNVDLPDLQSRLDTAATTLRDAINGALGNGFDLDGLAGQPLFTGTGGSDLQVALTNPRGLAFAAGTITSTAGVTTSGAVLDLNSSFASQAGNLATPPTASGTLTVNGTDIPWTDAMTPAQLMNALSAAGARATYDAKTQTFTLTRDPSKGSGPDIKIVDTAGNLGDTFKFTGAVLDKGIPGDARVAQYMAGFTTRPVLSGRTLGNYLQDAASTAAAGAGDAKADFVTAEALRGTIDETRSSEFGVNTDEEGVKMLQYQRAYEAAVRLASTQDSLLDTLINRMAR